MPRRTSNTLAPSTVAALSLLGVALVVLGAIEWIDAISGVRPEPPIWVVGCYPICACVYGAVGIFAWVRRPANLTGRILVAGSLSLLIAGLAVTPQPPMLGTGIVVATLCLAIIVHVLHGFPSGRLRGRWSIATVATAYGVSLVLQVPLYLFGPPSPVQLSPHPALFDAGLWLQRAVGLVVMVSTAALLATRLWAATRAQRLVLAPLFGYGIATVLFIPISSAVFSGHHPIGTFVAQILAMGGVPLAVVAAIFLGGFAQTGELAELSMWLGASHVGRVGLRDALARALGDPTVELCFWAETIDGYVDAAGIPIIVSDLGASRSMTEVRLAERRVGAILYDGALIGEPGVVEAAGRVLALAINEERLTADLRASQADLRASRSRIVEAADLERRRLARDLHDGLQTRFVLLALSAHDAVAEPSAATATALREGIDQALTELRALVHGVMPAVLTERGLSAALEELVAASPSVAELSIDVPRRLGATVESACYFVIAEALTNSLKYAEARIRTISAHADGDTLVAEVTDDGIGGAVVRIGGGLAAMEDRVAALGGRLVLASEAGAGTNLRVELPCGS